MPLHPASTVGRLIRTTASLAARARRDAPTVAASAALTLLLVGCHGAEAPAARAAAQREFTRDLTGLGHLPLAPATVSPTERAEPIPAQIATIGRRPASTVGGRRGAVLADTLRDDAMEPAEDGAAIPVGTTTEPEVAPRFRAAAEAAVRAAEAAPTIPAPLGPYTLGAGAVIPVILPALRSDTLRFGSLVRARTGAAVHDAEGREVIPAGTPVTLEVLATANAGRPWLDLIPVSLELDGQSVGIPGRGDHAMATLHGAAGPVGQVGMVAAGTGVGVITGKLVAGTKGAIIGGLAGALLGTRAAVTSQPTHGTVPAGTTVHFELTSPLTRPLAMRSAAIASRGGR